MNQKPVAPCITYVQSCITAIGFPDNLPSLIKMANWHREESSAWITDLESLLYEDSAMTDEDESGYWTGAPWLTEGDIMFFYQTAFRPKWYIRRRDPVALTPLPKE